MKKFYGFLLACFFTAGMFSAPATVPTPADLQTAGYDPTTQVVLAIYPDEEAEVCGDIYFIGSFNNWGKGSASSEGWDNCEDWKFKPLPGFDGWYVARAIYPDDANDFQGKPLHVPSDRHWTWDYQNGDVNAWVNVGTTGTKAADIKSGYEGESNIAYSEAGAYVYELKYWKNHATPCVPIPSHKYTLVLFPPTCTAHKEWGVGAIGDFNAWASATGMSKTTYEGDEAYTLEITDQEGHAVKFRATNVSDWSNQIQRYDQDSAKWFDLDNYILPVATKDTTLVFDFSETNTSNIVIKIDTVVNAPEDTTFTKTYIKNAYRFGLCGEEQYEINITAKFPSLNAPDTVEMVGSWGADTWNTGVVMTKSGENYTATVTAYGISEFKIRKKGDTKYEVQMDTIKSTGNEPVRNVKFSEVWTVDGSNHVVNLDWSDPAKYAWSVPGSTGLFDLKSSDAIKPRKVVINGTIYIQKGDELYDVFGTLVK